MMPTWTATHIPNGTTLRGMTGRPSKPAPPDVHHRLREIRVEMGLTIPELAKRMQEDPQQVRRWELGQRQLKPATAKKAADALGIDPAELFTRERITREERELLKIFRAMRAEKKGDFLAIGMTLQERQEPFRT